MASCEKCWADSYTITYGADESRIEKYQQLIKERSCTPEEQAGIDAGTCLKCERKAVHQITGDCMNCGLMKEHIKTSFWTVDEIIEELKDIDAFEAAEYFFDKFKD